MPDERPSITRLDASLEGNNRSGGGHPDAITGRSVRSGLPSEVGTVITRPKVVMDYPTAWAFVRETKPEEHHERCSWRTQNGALLCDCDVLWDEYVRRGGTDPRG